MPRKAEPTLKNCVKRLRKDSLGITQVDLAKQTKVTRQTIIALEAGDYTPSLALALRIARVFDLSVEEIFQLDE